MATARTTLLGILLAAASVACSQGSGSGTSHSASGGTPSSSPSPSSQPSTRGSVAAEMASGVRGTLRYQYSHPPQMDYAVFDVPKKGLSLIFAFRGQHSGGGTIFDALKLAVLSHRAELAGVGLNYVGVQPVLGKPGVLLVPLSKWSLVRTAHHSSEFTEFGLAKGLHLFGH